MQILDAIRDLNRAPWRDERRMSPDLYTVRPRRECSAKRAALHARTGEKHARIVHEIRLVDDDIRPVRYLHRERRLNAVERADRALGEEVLGAIQARSVGGDPPRAAVVCEGKLRELVGDLVVGDARLVRQLVTETDAVVEGADSERKVAIWRRGLGDLNAQLVVMIADARDFAPRLRPSLVEGGVRLAGNAKAIAQRRCIPDREAESRGKDDVVPLAR